MDRSRIDPLRGVLDDEVSQSTPLALPRRQPVVKHREQGIRKVVADVVADLESHGEAMPEPIATKQYSGQFMVRVPPDLQRRLVLEAAEAGISLH